MPPHVAPGSVFGGDFRVVRPLSEGGMGSVFVAEQISTGKERALKLMHAELVADGKLRERFAQEARIGARIESDHVVEVVGAGVDAQTGMPWLAMELLRGETLTEMVARVGPLDAPTVREVYGQLCHALSAAHQAGIVHRDLKPDNIFLAGARRMGVPFTLKVLDFGIAKLVAESHTKHTATIGTPLWMAPEQTEVGKAIKPACDVWALGLIAYYLFTGRPYWHSASVEGSGPLQLLREVVMEPIEAASSRAQTYAAAHRIPRGFDGWFARCVVRDVEHRFRDAREAHAELERSVFGGIPSFAAVVTEPSVSARLPTSGVAPTVSQLTAAPDAIHSPAVVVRAQAPTVVATTPVADDGEDDPYRPPTPASRTGLLVLAGVIVAAAIGGAIVFARSDQKPRPRPVTHFEDPPTEDLHHQELPSERSARTDPPSVNPVDDLVPVVAFEPKPNAPQIQNFLPLLDGARPRLDACYVKALAENPSVGGRVLIAFTVAGNGVVESPKVTTSLENTGVVDCFEQVFRSLVFSAPAGGALPVNLTAILGKQPSALAHLPLTAPSPSSSASIVKPLIAPTKPPTTPQQAPDLGLGEPTPTPAGHIVVGASTGGNSMTDVDAVVARNKWRFRACYLKVLVSNPTIEGTIHVQTRVGGGGEVDAVTITKSDVGSPGLDGCVASQFHAMKFDPPSGGSGTFSVPLTFSTKKN